MLAEMGEHQLMIRDYLRHSDLDATNKYLQATTKSKRLAQGKLVDAAYWTQTDSDRFSGSFVNHSREWRGRRDSNPRPLP
jgi:hypothetical protein